MHCPRRNSGSASVAACKSRMPQAKSAGSDHSKCLSDDSEIPTNLEKDRVLGILGLLSTNYINKGKAEHRGLAFGAQCHRWQAMKAGMTHTAVSIKQVWLHLKHAPEKGRRDFQVACASWEWRSPYSLPFWFHMQITILPCLHENAFKVQ